MTTTATIRCSLSGAHTSRVGGPADAIAHIDPAKGKPGIGHGPYDACAACLLNQLRYWPQFIVVDAYPGHEAEVEEAITEAATMNKRASEVARGRRAPEPVAEATPIADEAAAAAERVATKRAEREEAALRDEAAKRPVAHASRSEEELNTPDDETELAGRGNLPEPETESNATQEVPPMTAAVAETKAAPASARSEHFAPGVALYATFKGVDYEAMTFDDEGKTAFEITKAPGLNGPDGKPLAGTIYNSPSSAGRAITGGAVNGYVFWKTEPKAAKVAPAPKATRASAPAKPRATAPAAKKAPAKRPTKLATGKAKAAPKAASKPRAKRPTPIR